MSCAVDGCGRGGRLVRGWCRPHYKRWRRHGDPLGGAPERTRERRGCAADGCDADHYGKGYCALHYGRASRHGDPHRVDPPKGPIARPMGGCRIDGCAGSARSHAPGYCGMHHQRLLRHGDPLWEPPTFAERFWAKVDVGHPLGCWQWIGAVLDNGYGHFENLKPHRVAYELLVGSIGGDLHLDHLCRNRACVNPDHLEPVTQYENWRRGYSPSAKATRERTAGEWGQTLRKAA